MVKERPGSRKGKTKQTSAGRRSARSKAGKLRKRAHQRQHVLHEAMRDKWDSTKTPRENLAHMGLQAEVNNVEKRTDSTVRMVKLSDVGLCREDGEQKMSMDVDMNVLRQLEAHANMKERGTKQVVRPGEKLALMKLIEKYGKDWEGMARDVKLNYLQWTPRQLEKRVTRMQQIVAQQK